MSRGTKQFLIILLFITIVLGTAIFVVASI